MCMRLNPTPDRESGHAHTQLLTTGELCKGDFISNASSRRVIDFGWHLESSLHYDRKGGFNEVIGSVRTGPGES